MTWASDDTLVKLAQAGDRAALSELLGRYEKKAYHLAYRLTGNHADAADGAQEGLIRVFTRLHNFRGDSAFSTWLFRVVSNTCLDELRRRGRVRCAPLDAPDGPEEDRLALHGADEGDGPADVAERHEVQAAVQHAVGLLPDEYRLVVVLRDLQDHTYLEIATMLDITIGTVKSRLHRARHALRAILQRGGDLPECMQRRIAG